MFVGLVNSVRMHCSHRKSTFTAKKKKKAENANGPDPNATQIFWYFKYTKIIFEGHFLKWDLLVFLISWDKK